MTKADKAVRQHRISMASRQILSTLAGIKSVTRRPIRGDIYLVSGGRARKGSSVWNDPAAWGTGKPGAGYILTLWPADSSDEQVLGHLYGEPGDQLIITETCARHGTRRRALPAWSTGLTDQSGSSAIRRSKNSPKRPGCWAVATHGGRLGSCQFGRAVSPESSSR